MSFFGVLRGLISDAISRGIRIDASTHAIETIAYSHHEVHAGSSFTCHYNNDVTNIGEMTAIAFNVPNTAKWIHVVSQYASSGTAYFVIYENPSIDVDEGTQLTIYNRNRNSATASVVSSIETVPVANKATSYTEAQAASANITTTVELERRYIGAGDRKSVGGAARGEEEFILDQGNQYIFMLVSLTADDATHNITLDWYEHTDKN